MSKLVSIVYYSNWVGKIRQSNKKYFSVLITKEEWESFTELSKACETSVSTISKFLYKLEREKIITIVRKRKGDWRNKVIVNKSAWDYIGLWSRYRRLKFLFKEDIKRLLKVLSISACATAIGYGGIRDNRGRSLSKTLKKLNWYEEFKNEGII